MDYPLPGAVPVQRANGMVVRRLGIRALLSLGIGEVFRQPRARLSEGESFWAPRGKGAQRSVGTGADARGERGVLMGADGEAKREWNLPGPPDCGRPNHCRPRMTIERGDEIS